MKGKYLRNLLLLERNNKLKLMQIYFKVHSKLAVKLSNVAEKSLCEGHVRERGQQRPLYEAIKVKPGLLGCPHSKMLVLTAL